MEYVTELEKLCFEQDSNLYRVPTPSQLATFAALASTLLSGSITDLAQQADAIGYCLIKYADIPSGLVFYGLEAKLVDSKPTHGWGSYFLNRSYTSKALIEAPHPSFDRYTPEMAARIFRESRSKGFLLAGTHRYSNGRDPSNKDFADVAHVKESIFQEVHKVWIGSTDSVVTFQIHGYKASNSSHHKIPLGVNFIISNGDGSLSNEVLTLDRLLEDKGFDARAYNTLSVKDPRNIQVNGVGVSGDTFESLRATSNIQGQYSRSLKKTFVHIEIESKVRSNSEQRNLAADIIAQAILNSASID
ncbi:hypothetical protein [Scytonema sp. NUACC21]